MHLVAGASGHLGSKIVQRLLDRGEQVRAIVRGESSEAQLLDKGATVVRADLKDRSSLDRACEGVDVVITTANSVHRGGDDNIDSVDRLGTRNLIDAAKAAQVDRFVYVSVAGARPDHPVPLFAAKGTNEEHLKSSGMAYVILEPHVFMDIWIPHVIRGPLTRGEPVTLFEGGRKRHSLIAEDDVADFAVVTSTHPAAANRTLLLGGPTAHSWSEIVEMCSRRLGRPIEIRNAAPGDPLPGFPLPLGQILGGLLDSMERADVIIPMEQIYREFGIKPRTIEQFLDQFLATT